MCSILLFGCRVLSCMLNIYRERDMCSISFYFQICFVAINTSKCMRYTCGYCVKDLCGLRSIYRSISAWNRATFMFLLNRTG